MRAHLSGSPGLAIGLALTLIHLISIPVTNTSVNPARSTAPALFAGMAYIEQLWLFWLAPLVGAALGGFVHRAMLEPGAEPPIVGRPSVGSSTRSTSCKALAYASAIQTRERD